MVTTKYLKEETLLSIFAGDRDLAHEAIKSFAETLPGLLAPWEKNYKQKNSLELGKSSHALKGAVLAFGCQEIATKLGQLCQLCRQESSWDNIQCAFQDVWAQMRHLIMELKYWTG